uniref:RNase H type-1 domain-containing protein n=1 Tax=Triticum urartu TaxID=4572 RepID=A0A8R7Q2Y6_TRIUA
MVLRTDQGDIIFTACRENCSCVNGLEAELAACREGLELALHRTDLPILIEMDSVEAVNMLNASTNDRS